MGSVDVFSKSVAYCGLYDSVHVLLNTFCVRVCNWSFLAAYN